MNNPGHVSDECNRARKRGVEFAPRPRHRQGVTPAIERPPYGDVRTELRVLRLQRRLCPALVAVTLRVFFPNTLQLSYSFLNALAIIFVTCEYQRASVRKYDPGKSATERRGYKQAHTLRNIRGISATVVAILVMVSKPIGVPAGCVR